MLLEWLFPNGKNNNNYEDNKIPPIQNYVNNNNGFAKIMQEPQQDIDLNYETPVDNLVIKDIEPEDKIKAIVDEFIITIRNHDDFRNAFRVNDLAILLVYMYDENTVTLDLNSTIENVFDTIQQQGQTLDRTNPEIVLNAFNITTMRVTPLIYTSLIYTISKLKWLYTSAVNMNFKIYTLPHRKFVNVYFNLSPQLPGVSIMTINNVPFMKAFNDLIEESRNIIAYGKSCNL